MEIAHFTYLPCESDVPDGLDDNHVVVDDKAKPNQDRTVRNGRPHHVRIINAAR